jgi:hypothetical protein
MSGSDLGDHVLDDIEVGEGRADWHGKDFVGKVDQVRIGSFERENEGTSLVAIGDQIEQSLRSRVSSDDQDRLVTIDMTEAVGAYCDVAGTGRGWMPTDPGGRQFGTTGRGGLFGEMGHKMPRLVRGGPHHQKSAGWLWGSAQSGCKLDDLVIEVRSAKKPAQSRHLKRVHWRDIGRTRQQLERDRPASPIASRHCGLVRQCQRGRRETLNTTPPSADSSV